VLNGQHDKGCPSPVCTESVGPIAVAPVSCSSSYQESPLTACSGRWKHQLALTCHLCTYGTKSHLVCPSAGLNLLLEMLQSFQHSDFATQFHKTYYLTLMREIFAVMTGNAHTSSRGATRKKLCTVDFCITRILQMQCVDPAVFCSLDCLLQTARRAHAFPYTNVASHVHQHVEQCTGQSSSLGRFFLRPTHLSC